MTPLLDQLVETIALEIRRHGNLVPDGATNEELNDLDARMRQAFSVSLPDEYRRFLGKMDGFLIGPFQMAGTSLRRVSQSDETPLADLEIPEAVTHAQGIVIDYEPLFDSMIVLTYGPAFHGWDPQRQAWFRGYYETGPTRNYQRFEELLADLLHDCSGQEEAARALMLTDFRFSSTDEFGAPIFGTKVSVS